MGRGGQAATVAETPEKQRVYTAEEVAALAARGQHVYTFQGRVYDVNLEELMHPGGREVRLAIADHRQRCGGR